MTETSQVAALPIRRCHDGELEVLLVTSRETRRWVLPKGWLKTAHAPSVMAGIEAWEEAGVRGEVAATPLGAFSYYKRRNDTKVLIRVDVFLLDVSLLEPQWPEADQRVRRWFSLIEAAAAVDEAGLKTLILGLRPPAGSNAKARPPCPSTAPTPPSPSRPPTASRTSGLIGPTNSTR
jgi:8-oxo-dGTP pyrophosphatase MutT (NUDIX family)